MLARFSKLPGLTFLSHNSQYPQEIINEKVSEIKQLGKKPVNGEDSLKDISKILFYMKTYTNSIQIQRVSCHALSNLAMQVVAARWIIQKGGFSLIKKAMIRFHADHKLCWLASSAIWNLARPPANRNLIGKDGCKLMLKVLKEHNDKEKVTNTAIGALSNLSLLEPLKDLIAEDIHLKTVLDVMEIYLRQESTSVMTSGAGLIANLAVSDDHASKLVKYDTLNILLKLLKWNINTLNKNNATINDETLFRNTCAALNNLVTADGFLDKFLISQGIEILYDFLNKNSNNELYFNLLENCLVNMDCDPNKKTTSFHLAAFHNKINILKKLIKNNPLFNLDTKDENGLTPLDFAIMSNSNNQNENNNCNSNNNNNKKYTINKKACVELLSKCGATIYNKQKIDDQKHLLIAYQNGHNILKQVKKDTKQCLAQTLNSFPKDLCGFMVEFQDNIDLLEGMDLF